MTNKEAIKILKRGRLSNNELEAEQFCEAYEMAISALEQEPISVSVSEKEPDEISEEVTLRFFRNSLKVRWQDMVIYNVEWLKKNWQMEMDIVCGVKPCGDVVSREAVISEVNKKFNEINIILENLPPVRPQEPKWIPVSERLPKSSGVYIVSRWFSDGEESAILTDANYYDGNGDWYNDNRINWGRDLVTDKIVAWMPLPKPYEPQESEEV